MSRRPPRPLVIAHRGASAYRPENTLPAYALAVEQRADMIEIDLHRTRDGAIVIAHDADLAHFGAREHPLRCARIDQHGAPRRRPQRAEPRQHRVSERREQDRRAEPAPLECCQRLGLDPRIRVDAAALDLEVERDPRCERVEHLFERGNRALSLRGPAHVRERASTDLAALRQPRQAFVVRDDDRTVAGAV